MPARLIDGRAHARAIREELKLAVERHPGQRSPGITVIQVGNDLASTTYVRGKHKAAEEVGFKSAIAHLHDITQADLNNRIRALADDPTIDGILVQMPLPDGLDPDQALEQIPPHKDVDGPSVESVAPALTPVPGGVGPMTVAMLLVNTFRAYRQHLGQA